MTLDKVINRLEALREELGGDTPFCIEKEHTPSGSVNVFESANVEDYNVVHVKFGTKSHWVCLMNGNTSRIVVAY